MPTTNNVQYYNGQYYQQSPTSYSLDAYLQNAPLDQQISRGWLVPVGAPQGQGQAQQTPAPGNPFSSASSGGVPGTLQPYVNRMTQNANQALYGGLLGYQPQSIISGNAGGTPIHSTPPQWKLPSAIPTPNQGQVGLLGPQASNYMPQANPQQQMGVFGNRSWMVA